MLPSSNLRSVVKPILSSGAVSSCSLVSIREGVESFRKLPMEGMLTKEFSCSMNRIKLLINIPCRFGLEYSIVWESCGSLVIFPCTRYRSLRANRPVAIH